jgi:hypothetical protein
VVDGEAAGIWKYARHGPRISIEVAPFHPLAAEMRDQIGKEAADVGRFCGLSVKLSYAENKVLSVVTQLLQGFYVG